MALIQWWSGFLIFLGRVIISKGGVDLLSSFELPVRRPYYSKKSKEIYALDQIPLT